MPRQKQPKKLIIGITGNFGSGKSTVAAFFRKAGVKVIDADRLAHKAILPGAPCYKKVIAGFGKGILNADKQIDRKRLKELAFADKKKIKRLNRIIHPEVIRQIKTAIAKAKEHTIVLDVPLLIESGLHRAVDQVIVVKTDLRQQVSRIKNKLSLSEPEIFRRLKFQLPLKKKVRLADFVIDNSGSLQKTREQVKMIINKVIRRH